MRGLCPTRPPSTPPSTLPRIPSNISQTCANNDDNGNLGTQPDGGIILAQMTGPGCIWRIWSAQVGAGHVKIFLDGSNTPAVDLAFQDYFNRSAFPFNYPSLTYVACGGFNSYLPIPYNEILKSQKLEQNQGWEAWK